MSRRTGKTRKAGERRKPKSGERLNTLAFDHFIQTAMARATELELIGLPDAARRIRQLMMSAP